MDPKISVIIVLYNAEKSIKSTLDSLAIQTYRDYEVVVIDGKSKDNTLSVVNSYREKFPLMRVYSDKDKGIYDAMNKGISLAKGEYLYFLNAGDLLYDEKVFQIMSNKFNGQSVFYGDAYIKDSEGRINEYRCGNFSKYRLALTNICHQTIFYPAFVFKNEMFDLSYYLLADWAMNMKLWRKHEFRHVKCSTILYEGGGVSDIEIDKKFKEDRRKNIFKNLGLDAWVYTGLMKVLRIIK